MVGPASWCWGRPLVAGGSREETCRVEGEPCKEHSVEREGTPGGTVWETAEERLTWERGC